MFTFSKVITLGVLLTGTSGLSAYLIPYYLSEAKPEGVNKTLFSNSYDKSDNLENFSSKEKELLGDLKILFQKLSEILKKSFVLGGLKYEKMKELFKSSLDTDSQISSLYENGEKIISELEKFSEIIKKKEISKLSAESELIQSKSSESWLKQLGSSIEKLLSFFETTIEAIEKGQESSSTSGGDIKKIPIAKLLKEQKKH
ncbi:hypothetical protein [Mycoplasma suis]|uniref:Uncharacterized protein n=1 Tax=Mycoplasma suis (strain Illinois) TaxID=768700 RepID=F0QRR3_MYCSL|nr:hypothetical protein [Mycoplasma suis]ADX98183.1 hypothetical protein MSU_0652 [Mycoplasma suis str. Illinois]